MYTGMVQGWLQNILKHVNTS